MTTHTLKDASIVPDAARASSKAVQSSRGFGGANKQALCFQPSCVNHKEPVLPRGCSSRDEDCSQLAAHPSIPCLLASDIRAQDLRFSSGSPRLPHGSISLEQSTATEGYALSYLSRVTHNYCRTNVEQRVCTPERHGNAVGHMEELEPGLKRLQITKLQFCSIAA